jgi:hypothetical protein
LCDAICEGRNASRNENPAYPIMIVGKRDENIVFPPFKRSEKLEKSIVQHKKFTKPAVAHTAEQSSI